MVKNEDTREVIYSGTGRWRVSWCHRRRQWESIQVLWHSSEGHNSLSDWLAALISYCLSGCRQSHQTREAVPPPKGRCERETSLSISSCLEIKQLPHLLFIITPHLFSRYFKSTTPDVFKAVTVKVLFVPTRYKQFKHVIPLPVCLFRKNMKWFILY